MGGPKVFFGGDSNVYYGGEDEMVKINELKDALEKEDVGYTLVIAKHIVRKVRPDIYFNNAQAAYKKETKQLETMFFAYPTKLEKQMVPVYGSGREGDALFDDKLTQAPPKVVDAFARAAHNATK